MQDQQLSANFRLSEFTASQEASRWRLDNEPSPQRIENLRRVAELLERVRAALSDAPVVISSGYRCVELNRRIGGAVTSAHLDGRAADFSAPRFGTPREICARLVREIPELPFDQLILEGTWVHLGIAPLSATPRREVLTACFHAGAPTTYARGLLSR